MIENYRSGLVQNLFMQNEYATIAMQKAGFTGVNTTTTIDPNEFKTYETPTPEKNEIASPTDDPSGLLLVENFDDCISKNGAGAWHGGSSTTEECVIMFDSSENHGEEGCSLKIKYNVEKKGAFNGAWIKLGNMDLKGYDGLGFWVKGDRDEGFTTAFKVEIKSSNGRGEYIVRGVNNSWKEVTVPFAGFKTPSGSSRIDWNDVIEFTIVFEDWRATDKKGAVYIDDIHFTQSDQEPTLTPAPTPTSTPKIKPTSTLSQSPQPGFGTIFAITGLLAVAYLIGRRK